MFLVRYQFLVSGVRNLYTGFWWPVSGTRNLGGELRRSCAIRLIVPEIQCFIGLVCNCACTRAKILTRVSGGSRNWVYVGHMASVEPPVGSRAEPLVSGLGRRSPPPWSWTFLSFRTCLVFSALETQYANLRVLTFCTTLKELYDACNVQSSTNMNDCNLFYF